MSDCECFTAQTSSGPLSVFSAWRALRFIDKMLKFCCSRALPRAQSFSFGLCLLAVLIASVYVEPAHAQTAPAIIDINIVSQPALGGTYLFDETIEVALTFDETVIVTGVPLIELNIGGPSTARYVSGSGRDTLIFAYTVEADVFDGGAGISVVENALAQDGDIDMGHRGGAGVAIVSDDDTPINLSNSARDFPDVRVDGRDNPTLTAIDIVSQPALGGTYLFGETIEVALTFDETVTVTGVPLIELNIGGPRTARYVRGSGNDTLIFAYTVEADVFDDGDGISVVENTLAQDGDINMGHRGGAGVAIVSDDDTPIDLSNSARDFPDVRVDGRDNPTLTAIDIVSQPASGDTYLFDETIEVALTFDETVTVTGVPLIELNIGGPRTARYVRGSGSDTLIFAYTVEADVFDDGDGISVVENTLAQDGDINMGHRGGAGVAIVSDDDTPINLSNSARDFPDVRVDGRDNPTLTAIDIVSQPALGGTYLFDETIEVALTFDETVTVTGVPLIELNIGGPSTARYVRGSGSDTLIFAYTVEADVFDDGDGISVVENTLAQDGDINMGHRGGAGVAIVSDDDTPIDLSNSAQDFPDVRVDGSDNPTLLLLGYTGFYALVGDFFTAGRELAMPLITGPNANGYLLQSVELPVTRPDVAGFSDLTVALRSASEDGPGDVLATFTAPGDDVSGRPTFTLPSRAFLQPNTTYFISYLNNSTATFNFFAAQIGDLETGSFEWISAISPNCGANDPTITLCLYIRDMPSAPWGGAPLITGVPAEYFGALITRTEVRIIDIVSQPASGDTYLFDETIEVALTFDETVTVTGVPLIELNIGGPSTARYVSGSGSDTLIFAYTVEADVFDGGAGISVVENALAQDGDIDMGHRGGAGVAIVSDDDTPINLSNSARNFPDVFVDGRLLCARTLQVREAILNALPGVTDCAAITDADLNSIIELDLAEMEITALKVRDFAGLAAMTTLNLSLNELSSLPAGVFNGLVALTALNLNNNQLSDLSAGIFNFLPTSLTELTLHENELSPAAFPDGVFERFRSLRSITLFGNPGSDSFRPLANAGPERTVRVGETVTLDGIATDGGPFGTNLIFAWLQAEEDAIPITLTGADTATPTFIVPTDAPVGSVFRFDLRVTGRGEYRASAQAPAEHLTTYDRTTVTVTILAPTGLSATAGHKRVILEWMTGDGGGSAITHYQYRQKADGEDFSGWMNIPDGDDADSDAGNETSYTVTGLTNGTSYLFQVRAVNALGAHSEATAEVGARPFLIEIATGDLAITDFYAGPFSGLLDITPNEQVIARPVFVFVGFIGGVRMSGIEPDEIEIGNGEILLVRVGDECGFATPVPDNVICIEILPTGPNGSQLTMSLPADVADLGNAAAPDFYRREIVRSDGIMAEAVSMPDGPILTSEPFVVTFTFSGDGILIGIRGAAADNVPFPLEDYLEPEEIEVVYSPPAPSGGTFIRLEVSNSSASMGHTNIDITLRARQRYEGVLTVILPAGSARNIYGDSLPETSFSIEVDTFHPIGIVASSTFVVEGTTAVFTLMRDGLIDRETEVTVEVTETNEMVAAADEGRKSVAFAAGSSTAIFSVPTVEDISDEDDSVVTVRVNEVGSDYVVDMTQNIATVTIRDNDAVPDAPADLAAAAGDTYAVLSWDAPADPGASPIERYEYRASSDAGTVWNPDWTDAGDATSGVRTQVVSNLTNDTEYTFEVRAVSAIGNGTTAQVTATPSSATAVFILMFNPTEYTVNESEGRVELTLRLTGVGRAPQDKVTVTVSTRDGSAVTPQKYAAINNATIVFEPEEGVTELTQTVTVQIVNDIVLTPDDQSFSVVITDGTAAHSDDTVVIDRGRSEATVTIFDDGVGPRWDYTQELPSTVNESTAMNTVSIRLGQGEGLFDGIYTIMLEVGGTATFGEDYIIEFVSGRNVGSRTLPFTKGDRLMRPIEFMDGRDDESGIHIRELRLRLVVTDDTVYEADETIELRLTTSHPAATVSDDTTQTITLIDNDTTPVLSLSVGAIVIDEGASVDITVMTTATGSVYAEDQTITLEFTGDAMPEDDYTVSVDGSPLSSPYELTLPAGASSVTATITATEDTEIEADETITLTARHEGDTIGEETIMITDNDADVVTYTVSFDPTEYTVNESDGQVELTLTLIDEGRDPRGVVSVAVVTRGNSALGSLDYVTVPSNNPNLVEFNPGDVRLMSVIQILDDAILETEEIFEVLIFSVSAEHSDDEVVIGLGQDEATVTIVDDDAELNAAPVFTSSLSFEVNEGQTVVGMVTAEDANIEDEVMYSITGDADDVLFAIDPSSGELSFAAAPDFENPTDADMNNNYMLTVAAIGGTNVRALTTTQAITVTVLDVPTTITITADEAEVTEGESAVFVFERTDATDAPALTVNITVDATVGVLADAAPEMVTFDAGSATAELSLATDDDTLEEDDSVVTVTIIDDVGYRIGIENSASVRVVDDDVNVAPVFSSSESFEVNEGQTVVGTVTAEDANPQDEVMYSVTGGVDEALFTIDSSSGELSFTTAPDYENPMDADMNNNYMLTVTASGGTDARALTTTQAITVTVLDVVTTITITADEAEVIEGESAVFVFERTDATDAPVLAVNITVDDPDGVLAATAPEMVTFDAGSATAELSLATDDDTLEEDDSVVTVTIIDDVGYRIGIENSASVRVVDNDAVPGAPAELAAAAGDTHAVLSWDAPADPGTSPINHYEYRASSDAGTVWDPDWTSAGDATSEVRTQIVTDLTNDTEYTFEVRAVSAAGNGAAAQVTATPSSATAVFILTFDPSEYMVNESEGRVELTLRLTGVGRAPQDAVTVTFSARDGSAIAFEDYSGQQVENAEVVFSSANAQLSETLNIPIVDDIVFEPDDESFSVVIDNVSAAHSDDTVVIDRGRSEATVTIVDDGLAPIWNLQELPSIVNESTAMDTVSIILQNEGEALVEFYTIMLEVGGTATFGEDYIIEFVNAFILTGGSATIIPLTEGELLMRPIEIRDGPTISLGVLSFRLVVTDDTVYEADETIELRLSVTGHPAATVSDDTTQTITLIDNDTTPVLSLSSLSVGATEINEGASTDVVVEITNESVYAEDQTIALEFTGDAMPEDDYTVSVDGSPLPSPYELTLPAGASSVTATITATDDTEIEVDETITITARHEGDTIGEETITITSNDADVATFTVSFDPAEYTVNESDGQVELTLTLIGEGRGPQDDVTVTFSARDGSAVTFEDYVGQQVENAEVVFSSANAQLSATLNIPIVDDIVFEPDDEVFSVVIDDVTAAHSDDTAMIDQGEATVTIVDNDDEPELVLSVDMTAIDEGASVAIRIEITSEELTTESVFAEDQTITLEFDGTATEDDYTVSVDGSPHELILKAEEFEASATIMALIDDMTAEGNETIMITARHEGEMIGEETITIIDNVAPVFSGEVIFEIEEGLTMVGTMTAEDANPQDEVRYSVTGDGADDALFDIDPSSGELSFTTAPDYENPMDADTDNVYMLIVTAVGGTDVRALTTTQAITVTVLDVVTTITITADEAEVTEGESAVFVFERTDATDAPVLAVNITVDDPDGVLAAAAPEMVTFDAGSATAELSLATDDDTLEEDDSTVTVTIIDDVGYRIGIENSASVRVVDDDVNVAPAFTSAASFEVNEGQTVVGTVTAEDANIEDEVTYSITGGADDALFDIDSSSGELSFTTAPDFENPTDADMNNNYMLTVTASGGTDARALTTTQAITVTVLDVATTITITADEAEVIEGESAVFVFERTDATDAPVLAVNITVDDPDGVLAATAPEMVTFDAGSATAELSLATDDDTLEEDDSVVTVTIIDGADYRIGIENSASVRVVDDDVNVAPAFISAASFEVNEGETVVDTVTAADANIEDEVMYSVTGGADDALFDIDSSSGELSFTTAPDYENPTDVDTDNVYMLIVAAIGGTDVRALTTTQAITVTVLDVVTTITITADEAEITEGESAVFVFERTDATDAPVLAVNITVDDSGGVLAAAAPEMVTFDAGSATTELSLATDDDTLEEDDSTVTVTVIGGMDYAVGIENSASVRVVDDDVNVAPAFISAASFEVNEGQTVVGTVTAEDANIEDEVTYLITGDGADDALFDIDSSSGELSFTTAPDYENPVDADEDNNYMLTVTASGGTDARALTTTQAITVAVLDVATTITITAAEPMVTEGEPAVFVFEGTDASDLFVFFTVVESGEVLVAPTPSGISFGPASETVMLSVATIDDTLEEDDSTVTVTIGVDDMGFYEVGIENSASVRVVDNDVNVAPVFTSAASFEVNEGETVVGTVTAADANIEDEVTYSITNGADDALFDINPSSGELSFAIAPDVEADKVYMLTVTATGGTDARALTTTQEIEVTVLDVPTTITITADEAEVIEGEPAMLTLSRTDATDAPALTVNITVDATVGVLADAAPEMVTFDAGSATTMLSLATVIDDTFGVRTVTVTVNDGVDYEVGIENSAEVRVVDKDVVPGAPANLAAEAGDTQAVLSWDVPADSGTAPIDRYEYRVSADGGNIWDPDWTAAGDATSEVGTQIVSNLVNGTEYTFEVRAVSAAGNSAAARITATPIVDDTGASLTLRRIGDKNGYDLIADVLANAEVSADGSFEVAVGSDIVSCTGCDSLEAFTACEDTSQLCPLKFDDENRRLFLQQLGFTAVIWRAKDANGNIFTGGAEITDYDIDGSLEGVAFAQLFYVAPIVGLANRSQYIPQDSSSTITIEIDVRSAELELELELGLEAEDFSVEGTLPPWTFTSMPLAVIADGAALEDGNSATIRLLENDLSMDSEMPGLPTLSNPGSETDIMVVYNDPSTRFYTVTRSLFIVRELDVPASFGFRVPFRVLALVDNEERRYVKVSELADQGLTFKSTPAETGVLVRGEWTVNIIDDLTNPESEAFEIPACPDDTTECSVMGNFTPTEETPLVIRGVFAGAGFDANSSERLTTTITQTIYVNIVDDQLLPDRIDDLDVDGVRDVYAAGDDSAMSNVKFNRDNREFLYAGDETENDRGLTLIITTGDGKDGEEDGSAIQKPAVGLFSVVIRSVTENAMPHWSALIAESEEDAEIIGIGTPPAYAGSGVYDFEVIFDVDNFDLQARVVIPQREPIVEGSVYYEYINGDWWEIDMSEADRTYSAPRTSDNPCPSPDAIAYWTPGLNAGHRCVLLEVTDGGLNDADSEANGIVANTGAIGGSSVVVDRRRGGGGAVGLWWLLLFVGIILAAMVLKRRNARPTRRISLQSLR